MRGAILFLAAAALAAPAYAQAPAAASPTAQEPSAEALALAQLIEPGGESVSVAVVAAKNGFMKLLSEDADARSLEEDYPGIYEAAWTAIEPVIRSSVEADTPKLWDKLARLYTARLTPQEIAGLRRFYSTPTGRKLLRTMQENADLMPIMQAAAESATSVVSAEAMQKAQAPGRAAAVRTLTPEDDAAVKQLSQSISLPKLYAIGAEVQRVTLAWMNEPDPELDARIEKVVEKEMTRFMAEADAKK